LNQIKKKKTHWNNGFQNGLKFSKKLMDYSKTLVIIHKKDLAKSGYKNLRTFLILTTLLEPVEEIWRLLLFKSG
jgi:hypothetical protein